MLIILSMLLNQNRSQKNKVLMNPQRVASPNQTVKLLQTMISVKKRTVAFLIQMETLRQTTKPETRMKVQKMALNWVEIITLQLNLKLLFTRKSTRTLMFSMIMMSRIE